MMNFDIKKKKTYLWERMESKLPQVIRVSECGTEMVNGLYRAISKQVRYGALKYANARYPNIHVRLTRYAFIFYRRTLTPNS